LIMQRSLLVFIAFALAVTPCVYANDSALNEGAYGPMPVGGFEGHESVIRMRAERIEVEFGILYSKVDAHFAFRSTKPDAPARQLVGFPDLSAPAENASTLPQSNGPIENMRTYVDGKEVKSELKYGFVKWDDTVGFRASTPEDGESIAWYTIWVTFPPDRDVVIERKYRVRNGNNAYGNQTFSYITITGASWKGTIGHLEADIILADGLTINDLAWEGGPRNPETQEEMWVCSPKRSSWKILSPTRMRLVWDDFEPSTDKDKRDFFLATVGTRSSARIQKMADDAIKRREEWRNQSQPSATPSPYPTP
jgi:hypothetical protein